MSRYRESSCKHCRREGVKLFLKGTRCETKCTLDRRAYPGGQHGQSRKKPSEYAVQLREKQKVRRLYGVQERQFRRYYELADRKTGVTGTILLQLLESRLDSILYRAGLAPSRKQARQIICHGHIWVNGKKVDIPSYQVKTGDLVMFQPGSQAVLKHVNEGRPEPIVPHWLEVDRDKGVVRVSAQVTRDDLDSTISEALIVEYYSR